MDFEELGRHPDDATMSTTPALIENSTREYFRLADINVRQVKCARRLATALDGKRMARSIRDNEGAGKGPRNDTDHESVQSSTQGNAQGSLLRTARPYQVQGEDEDEDDLEDEFEVLVSENIDQESCWSEDQSEPFPEGCSWHYKYWTKTVARPLKKIGLAFFLGLVPMVGPTACAYMSYKQTYEQLKDLKIGREMQIPLRKRVLKHIMEEFMVGLCVPILGSFYNRLKQKNHRSVDFAFELVQEHISACNKGYKAYVRNKRLKMCEYVPSPTFTALPISNLAPGTPLNTNSDSDSDLDLDIQPYHTGQQRFEGEPLSSVAMLQVLGATKGSRRLEPPPRLKLPQPILCSKHCNEDDRNGGLADDEDNQESEECLTEAAKYKRDYLRKKDAVHGKQAISQQRILRDAAEISARPEGLGSCGDGYDDNGHADGYSSSSCNHGFDICYAECGSRGQDQSLSEGQVLAEPEPAVPITIPVTAGSSWEWRKSCSLVRRASVRYPIGSFNHARQRALRSKTIATTTLASTLHQATSAPTSTDIMIAGPSIPLVPMRPTNFLGVDFTSVSGTMSPFVTSMPLPPISVVQSSRPVIYTPRATAFPSYPVLFRGGAPQSDCQGAIVEQRLTPSAVFRHGNSSPSTETAGQVQLGAPQNSFDEQQLRRSMESLLSTRPSQVFTPPDAGQKAFSSSSISQLVVEPSLVASAHLDVRRVFGFANDGLENHFCDHENEEDNEAVFHNGGIPVNRYPNRQNRRAGDERELHYPQAQDQTPIWRECTESNVEDSHPQRQLHISSAGFQVDEEDSEFEGRDGHSFFITESSPVDCDDPVDGHNGLFLRFDSARNDAVQGGEENDELSSLLERGMLIVTNPDPIENSRVSSSDAQLLSPPRGLQAVQSYIMPEYFDHWQSRRVRNQDPTLITDQGSSCSSPSVEYPPDYFRPSEDVLLRPIGPPVTQCMDTNNEDPSVTAASVAEGLAARQDPHIPALLLHHLELTQSITCCTGVAPDYLRSVVHNGRCDSFSTNRAAVNRNLIPQELREQQQSRPQQQASEYAPSQNQGHREVISFDNEESHVEQASTLSDIALFHRLLSGTLPALQQYEPQLQHPQHLPDFESQGSVVIRTYDVSGHLDRRCAPLPNGCDGGDDSDDGDEGDSDENSSKHDGIHSEYEYDADSDDDDAVDADLDIADDRDEEELALALARTGLSDSSNNSGLPYNEEFYQELAGTLEDLQHSRDADFLHSQRFSRHLVSALKEMERSSVQEYQLSGPLPPRYRMYGDAQGEGQAAAGAQAWSIRNSPGAMYYSDGDEYMAHHDSFLSHTEQTPAVGGEDAYNSYDEEQDADDEQGESGEPCGSDGNDGDDLNGHQGTVWCEAEHNREFNDDFGLDGDVEQAFRMAHAYQRDPRGLLTLLERHHGQGYQPLQLSLLRDLRMELEEEEGEEEEEQEEIIEPGLNQELPHVGGPIRRSSLSHEERVQLAHLLHDNHWMGKAERSES